VKQSEVSLARLGALVGEPVNGGDLAEVDLSIDPAPAVAGTRGESRAAREIASARRLESRQAQLGLLPAIHARVSFDHYRPSGGSFEPRWTASLALELPLWDEARRYDEWRATSARADRALSDAESLDRELRVQALDAEAGLRIARERYDAARLGRAASDEALRLALDRYRAGLLPLGEWLSAGAEAERARARQVSAEAELVLARYRNLHAIGALR
jgi:outer membrane protein TolC